jgi:hypothetical protein
MFGGAHSNGQERKNKESTRIPNCRASGAQLTRQVQTRATAGEALRIANDAINFSSSSSRRTRLFVEDEHEDDNGDDYQGETREAEMENRARQSSNGAAP